MIENMKLADVPEGLGSVFSSFPLKVSEGLNAPPPSNSNSTYKP